MGTLMEILCEFPYGNPMGIPTWESYGNSHVGIPIWESHGNSHVGILWEFPWESYGNSHRKPVGMGWEWELKFHSHDNPVSRTAINETIILSRTGINETHYKVTNLRKYAKKRITMNLYSVGDQDIWDCLWSTN